MAVQDDSSVALIPSAYGTSKVYSVIPSNGNGDFTFSRSGNATRVNKGGYIETMGSNVPRLDYPLIDGVVQSCPALLLEPSRTNLVTYSEDFSTASSQGISLTSNNLTSPDGSLNATKIADDGGSGSHGFYYTLSASGSTNYTMSCFVKKGTTSYVGLQLWWNLGNGAIGFFDLDNGVLLYEYEVGTGYSASDSKIEDFGNGWYRISTVFQSPDATHYGGLVISNTAWTTGTSYNNSYSGSGDYIYAYGLQYEAGSYATSYIPTSGSTVTRSADECTDSGTSAEFNDSEGVLFVEALNPDETDLKIVSLSDGGGTSNIVFIGFNNPTGAIYYYVISGGSTQSTFLSSITDINQYQRCAVKYKENDFALWVNGFEIHSDSSGITPTGLDEINFAYGTTSYKFHTKTKQLMTFKTALTDSELETLTSWDSFNAMAKGQLYTIE